MSTPAAIAAVTAMLRAAIERRLHDTDTHGAIDTYQVTVTPPAARSLTAAPNQLVVFFHHAVPDQAARNRHERPGADGSVAGPPLALQLVYLVTSNAVDPYAGELLIGHAMAALHDLPVLDAALPDDGSVPRLVADSGVDLQLEPIRVVPLSLTLDELSRLWQSLGMSYRPTVAYQVGPVVIDPLT